MLSLPLQCCETWLSPRLSCTADLDHDNVINYAEFTQALRQGRLQYMPLNPNIKTRTLPDPDNPFGDPNADMKCAPATVLPPHTDHHHHCHRHYCPIYVLKSHDN